jgi:hypothetical protein
MTEKQQKKTAHPRTAQPPSTTVGHGLAGRHGRREKRRQQGQAKSLSIPSSLFPLLSIAHCLLFLFVFHAALRYVVFGCWDRVAHPVLFSHAASFHYGRCQLATALFSQPLFLHRCAFPWLSLVGQVVSSTHTQYEPTERHAEGWTTRRRRRMTNRPSAEVKRVGESAHMSPRCWFRCSVYILCTSYLVFDLFSLLLGVALTWSCRGRASILASAASVASAAYVASVASCSSRFALPCRHLVLSFVTLFFSAWFRSGSPR